MENIYTENSNLASPLIFFEVVNKVRID